MLYVKYGKNRLHASEEMSFENVDDDGRRTDACLYYKVTHISAFGSVELIIIIIFLFHEDNIF